MILIESFYDVLGVGIAAFVATNIDDLFILMAFFANLSFPTSQIILGQYVGMGLLLGVSLVGSLIALVVPSNLIGLIGIFPIALGIKELLELRKKDDDGDEEQAKQLSQNTWVAYIPFLTVAAVTFSGGEEISIYTSIFAAYNKVSEITTIVSVVMVLTGVWCGIAAYLVHHSFLAYSFRRIARRVLPFLLIGLGIYILIEAFLIPSLHVVLIQKLSLPLDS